MDYHISDLLDCLDDAGQALKPRGGNAARVKAQVFARLHGAQSLPTAQTVQRPRRNLRPLRVLAAAALALMLLCGSVFAAWKLGAFRFTEEFGPAGEALDAYAQSYAPDGAEAIAADYGYASWVKADLGDYNLTLNALTAADGLLHAVADLSPKREGLPAFRDSGLALAFADYETVATPPRQIDRWLDRVELYATLDAPLSADAEVRFSLSGPGTEPSLAAFRMDALDKAWETLAASDRTHYATSAETRDYRFCLRSLTASPSVIYAVLDVEALTDFGLAHLDTVPMLVVENSTHDNSGTLLDARLLGQEEGRRRYLIGFLGNQALNEAGDSIGFMVMDLVEDGDMAGHPYYLFHVKLESLIPDAIRLSDPQGAPSGSIRWQTISVDAIGLSVEGMGQYRTDEPGPRVTLIFGDGRSESVRDEDWRPGTARTEHDAAAESLTGWHDGTAHLSIVFGAPLDVSALSAVIVDGQRFELEK